MNGLVRHRSRNLVRAAHARSPLFGRRFDQAVSGKTPGPEGLVALAHFGPALVVDCTPAALDRTLLNRFVERDPAIRRAQFFLGSGEWNPAILATRDDLIHLEMYDLIAHGGEYRDGPAYQRLDRAASRGRAVRRNGVALDSATSIASYCDHYLDLIRTIQRDGYKRRDELEGEREAAFRPRLAGLREREIGVAIDRHGRMLRFVGGRHRTAIAMLLDLPSIPVIIRHVHRNFLRDLAERTDRRPYVAFHEWLGEHSARGTRT